jgi:hypothetical protein
MSYLVDFTSIFASLNISSLRINTKQIKLVSFPQGLEYMSVAIGSVLSGVAAILLTL